MNNENEKIETPQTEQVANVFYPHVIKRKWEELSDAEKNIMGRPNFACGRIAERMRQMGFDCPRKAEHEQSLVIFTMLQFYKEYGEDWGSEMEKCLKNGGA